MFAEAAQLIEERGWTKGRFEDDCGRLCPIGALGVVSINDSSWNIGPVPPDEFLNFYRRYEKDLSDFVSFLAMKCPEISVRFCPKRYLPTSMVDITRWNDMEGNSKENVIATLREFASR
jgi:hypothetical protein